MAAAPAARPALSLMASAARLASAALRQTAVAGKTVRLAESFSKEVVDDIFSCALKKQTGVSLKYM